MCGIAGILNYEKINDLMSQCKIMINELKHRGPDNNGFWIDESSNICLGHSRLSIIDVSDKGSQPMHSYCGRYVVSYNGEIYNFKLIKQKLISKGIIFKGQSDTEVLINSISFYGLEKTLQSINGMFVFALWDKEKKELSICRDRFGQKPIHYCQINHQFYFASEIKALKKILKNKLELSQESILNFTKYGYINKDKTIYKNVNKILPASFIKFNYKDLKDNKPIIQKKYWSIRDKVDHNKSYLINDEKEAQTLVENSIEKTVKDCMVSDVPIGSFLSGGIDSSLITYYMQKNSTKKINTFSVGNKNSDFDESSDAQIVANQLGTSHQEFFIDKKHILPIVEKLPSIYDEPFADSSQIPSIFLSHNASRDTKVILTGDGGDEMFAGYNRHIFSKKIMKLLTNFPYILRVFILNLYIYLPYNFQKKLISILLKEKNYKLLDVKIDKFIKILPLKDQRQVYDSFCSQHQNVSSLFNFPHENNYNLNYFSDWPNVFEYLDQIMILDTENYLSDDILVKVDRATMHSSIESRAPFLNNEIFDIAWKLPNELKVRNNKGKYILRKILQNQFPSRIFEKPKMGFGIPIGDLIKNELFEWSEDLLSKESINKFNYLNHEKINKLWVAHKENKKDLSYILWNILNFQSWCFSNI